MRLAILSDTHGLLRPEVLPYIEGVDHILHAGDVGSDAILDQLTSYAPLTAIRGNIDHSAANPRCRALPQTEAIELHGKLFYLVHSLQDLDVNPITAGIAAVVTGHSHKPKIHTENGVLYLNPGSCGPRRFSLPITLALMTTENLTSTLITLL